MFEQIFILYANDMEKTNIKYGSFRINKIFFIKILIIVKVHKN